MEAYEFYAMPENGVIVIPEQYKQNISSGVKVILLKQEFGNTRRRRAKSINKSEMLLAPTISTNGWKFSRETANER